MYATQVKQTTHLFFLSFFGFSTLFAQSITPDSSAKALPLVDIKAARVRHAQALNEIEGHSIFAARKTDVILPENTDANLALNNPRQVFARVAGMVALENDGSGLQNNLSFRGLSPNRSWEFNTRQNGYDISADNFGYPEAYYAPPMELVQRIEIVRGASSLQFGPQIGGLLQYNLKKAPANRKISIESRQTGGSYGLFNSFNALGGTLGKFSYYASAHYRSGDGWRDNSAFNSRHFYLNSTFTPGDKIKIGLEVTRAEYLLQVAGGLTDSQYKDNPRQSQRSRNWFNVPWTLGALTFDWQPAPHTKLNVKAFGLLGERNSIGFTSAITTPDTINKASGQYANRQLDRFDFNNYGLETRLLQEYQLGGRKQALAAGLRLYQGKQTRMQRGKGDRNTNFNLDLQEEAYPFDMDYSTQNAAIFAENIFRTGKLALTAGLRYEFVQASAMGRIGRNSDGAPINSGQLERNRQFLLAGVGAEYHLRDHNEFYVNLASSYRPVLFSDLTPAATTDEIDPKLRDSKALTAELGYRGQWKEWLHLDLSAYYLLYRQRIGNLTLLREDGQTRYQFRSNLGDSQSFGTEVYAEADLFKALQKSGNWGNLSIFAALAWTVAEYGDFETSIFQNNQLVKGNLKGNQVEYAPAYVHRFGLNYVRNGFSTTAGVSRTAAVFTDANNTEAASANGQAGKLPAYTVADWSSAYNFRKGISIALGINNLFNTNYAARRAGGYPGPGLLPGEARGFYVTLGYKY